MEYQRLKKRFKELGWEAILPDPLDDLRVRQFKIKHLQHALQTRKTLLQRASTPLAESGEVAEHHQLPYSALAPCHPIKRPPQLEKLLPDNNTVRDDSFHTPPTQRAVEGLDGGQNSKAAALTAQGLIVSTGGPSKRPLHEQHELVQQNQQQPVQQIEAGEPLHVQPHSHHHVHRSKQVQKERKFSRLVKSSGATAVAPSPPLPLLPPLPLSSSRTGNQILLAATEPINDMQPIEPEPPTQSPPCKAIANRLAPSPAIHNPNNSNDRTQQILQYDEETRTPSFIRIMDDMAVRPTPAAERTLAPHRPISRISRPLPRDFVVPDTPVDIFNISETPDDGAACAKRQKRSRYCTTHTELAGDDAKRVLLGLEENPFCVYATPEVDPPLRTEHEVAKDNVPSVKNDNVEKKKDVSEQFAQQNRKVSENADDERSLEMLLAQSLVPETAVDALAMHDGFYNIVREEALRQDFPEPTADVGAAFSKPAAPLFIENEAAVPAADEKTTMMAALCVHDNALVNYPPSTGLLKTSTSSGGSTYRGYKRQKRRQTLVPPPSVLPTLRPFSSLKFSLPGSTTDRRLPRFPRGNITPVPLPQDMNNNEVVCLHRNSDTNSAGKGGLSGTNKSPKSTVLPHPDLDDASLGQEKQEPWSFQLCFGLPVLLAVSSADGTHIAVLLGNQIDWEPCEVVVIAIGRDTTSSSSTARVVASIAVQRSYHADGLPITASSIALSVNSRTGGPIVVLSAIYDVLDGPLSLGRPTVHAISLPPSSTASSAVPMTEKAYSILSVESDEPHYSLALLSDTTVLVAGDVSSIGPSFLEFDPVWKSYSWGQRRLPTSTTVTSYISPNKQRQQQEEEEQGRSKGGVGTTSVSSLSAQEPPLLDEISTFLPLSNSCQKQRDKNALLVGLTATGLLGLWDVDAHTLICAAGHPYYAIRAALHLEDLHFVLLVQHRESITGETGLALAKVSPRDHGADAVNLPFLAVGPVLEGLDGVTAIGSLPESHSSLVLLGFGNGHVGLWNVMNGQVTMCALEVGTGAAITSFSTLGSVVTITSIAGDCLVIDAQDILNAVLN